MLFHKTLFFRAFLLFFIIIVTSIVIISSHFWAYLVNPIAQRASDNIYRQISLIQESQRLMDHKNHSHYLKQITRKHRIFLKPENEKPNAAPASKRYQKLVDKALQKKLNNRSTAVLFGSYLIKQNEIDITWIKTKLGHQMYWIGFPRLLPKTLFLKIVTQQVIFILTMTLLLGLVVTYSLKKPLQKLIEAANTLSKGIIPNPIPETGSWEFQQLAIAFNTMSHNLQANANEKALMLAGISHDLRTPLSRIRLGLEILSPNHEQELTNDLIDDVENIDTVLEQFLAFANNYDNEPKCSTQLNDIIIAIADHYINEKHTIELKLNPIPELQLRKLSIKRLLNNLIDNGLQYGGQAITISTRRVDNEVVLLIKDKGQGIPTDELALAKLPFKRLQNSHLYSEGTGLGLSIVDKIARSHGAHFELRSEKNEGLEACIKFLA